MKGFQINRPGNYEFTIHADNEEGSDSKTIEVTFLGKVIKTGNKKFKSFFRVESARSLCS